MTKPTIVQEIEIFLAATGVKKAVLAKEAGITPQAIYMLLAGQRKNVLGPTQDRLRAAMRRLKCRAGRKVKYGQK